MYAVPDGSEIEVKCFISMSGQIYQCQHQCHQARCVRPDVSTAAVTAPVAGLWQACA
jgi:hypothetical protein